MRTKATFIIDPEDYPSGLVLSLTASPSDGEYGQNQDATKCSTSTETVTVNFSISSNSSNDDYLYGILFILIFIFSTFVLALIISVLGFVYKYMDGGTSVETEARDFEEAALDTESTENSNSVVEDIERLHIKVKENQAQRMNQNITLTDLSKKMDDPSKVVEVYQKTDLHWPVIVIFSIFYSIPAFQLVTSEGPYHTKTNQDVCYYNFLCLKPAGKLSAFNHVFSNIGYVCYGILFIALVSLKKRKFAKAIAMIDHHEAEKFGVPQDFSLFYGMGVALMMEGVMSGCYHICPKNIFFQFDTTFMYLIGILMIVKLYQNRHPDLSLGAIKTGILLGILLVFEAISYYRPTSVFWITFCSMYLVIIMIVALHTYTLGALEYNHLILWNFIRLFFMEVRRALLNPSAAKEIKTGQINSVRVRLVFVAFLILYNFGHVLFIIINISWSSVPLNASNHLLILIMAHLFIYTMFYITMKLMHEEFLTWSCRLYFIVSVVMIIISIYFFLQSPKKQDESPSISRHSNQECILFNFYDSHDLWHFLSAGGLFTTFMFFLNIDEDLKYTPRKYISVF